MKFIYQEKEQPGIKIDIVFEAESKYEQILRKSYTERNCITWLYDENPEKQRIVAGLGSKNELTLEDVRKLAGNIAQSLKEHDVEEIQVCLDQLYPLFPGKSEVVEAWVEGTVLGSYSFDQYRNKKTATVTETYFLVGKKLQDAEAVIQDTCAKAKSMYITRNLVNEPANKLNPKTFVEKIIDIFKDTDVDLNIVQGEAIEEQQLVGLSHVGRGSEFSPAMIELSYRPNKNKPHIVLVGKGITFDMGGMISKNARDLSEARFDMGGAGAVIGSLHYLASQHKDVNVSAFIMIAENVPDANAYLPSTIIEYPNGVSVEVANTDAEGRLILADGLIRSAKIEPDEVIDICTLTGSVGIALGSDMAGVWSTGDIAASMQEIGAKNGDLAWELPLVYDYKRYIKSDYADVHNIGATHEGGATIAALILHHFAPKNVPWAHIDMAATVQSRENNGYLVKGATGYGVRLLSDYILSK